MNKLRYTIVTFIILIGLFILITNLPHLTNNPLLDPLLFLSTIIGSVAFLIYRIRKLINEHMPFWCVYGFHKLSDGDRKYYMRGTGKYVNGNEIEEKMKYSTHKCERRGCRYTVDING